MSSLVAKIKNIHILLFLTINENWPLIQMDMKNMFLNRDLEVEVCMDIPPELGYESVNRTQLCKM